MDMTMKDYVNWKMSHDIKYEEAEGYPLILEKCRKNKNLKNFRIYGNSTQGENLFDETTATPMKYIDDNGVEQTGTAEGLRLSDYIEVEPQSTYALTVINELGKNVTLRINCYDSDKNWTSQEKHTISTTKGSNGISIPIIPVTTRYLRISFSLGTVVLNKAPTPDNPIEVESVGDLTTNNLLYGNKSHTIDGMTLSIEGSVFTIGGERLYTGGQPLLNYDSANSILLKANTNYTFSTHYISGEFEEGTEPVWIGLKNVSSGWIQCATGGTTMAIRSTNYKLVNKRTFSVSEDILVSFGAVGYFTKGNVKIGIQLEEGDTATEYEPSKKYKIPIIAKGKNLYKPTRVSAESMYTPSEVAKLSNNYGTVLDTTDATKGEFTVTQTKTDTSYASNHFMNGYFAIEVIAGKLIPDRKYRMSFDCEILSNPLGVNQINFSINGVKGIYPSLKNGRVSFTYTHAYNTNRDSDNQIIVYNAGMSLKISNIMITEPDYDSSYESYIEPQTTNIYLDTPLYKVADVSDYIDFEKKVLVQKCRKMNLSVIGGRWVPNSSTDEDPYVIFTAGWDYILPNGSNSDYRYGAFSNTFVCLTGGDDGNVEKIILYGYGRNARVKMLKSRLSELTNAGFLNWCNEHNSYMVRILVTPTEESIELPKLPQFKRTIIYEVDTSVKPSNMYGKYVKKY